RHQPRRSHCRRVTTTGDHRGRRNGRRRGRVGCGGGRGGGGGGGGSGGDSGSRRKRHGCPPETGGHEQNPPVRNINDVREGAVGCRFVVVDRVRAHHDPNRRRTIR